MSHKTELPWSLCLRGRDGFHQYYFDLGIGFISGLGVGSQYDGDMKLASFLRSPSYS